MEGGGVGSCGDDIKVMRGKMRVFLLHPLSPPTTSHSLTSVKYIILQNMIW